MEGKQNYERTFPVSWEQLHRDSRALAWKLLEIGYFERIVAVTRGGLVPAAVVARELDIRIVDTVCVSGYDWQDQKGDVEILKSLEGRGRGALIVDDLVDTGRTAQVVRRMLPEARFATVYAKPAGKPLVDDFVTEVSQNTWILFPWDTESTFVQPMIDRKRTLT